MTGASILHGDKGYDSNAVRRKIESMGAAPNIPPKANRRWKSCFSPCLYRGRNAVRSQAIGRSRGGRTTKIHALTDLACRPIAFLLTGGHVADCVAADTLLERMTGASILHGDKGYDSNAVRRKIESMGAAPNIPPKANRRWKSCFSPCLYRGRNAIERMFGRIKDFRRIATRYDKLGRNFLAAVCLVATVCYWL